MRLQPVSENALMLYLEQAISHDVSNKIQHCVEVIEQELHDSVIDLVPSYASLLIVFRADTNTHLEITRRIRSALANAPAQQQRTHKTVVLPVYYSQESGADLHALAQRAKLSIAEAIELHSARDYQVFAIGFAPGFAYLGEVDSRIAAPRLATPRAQVPSGSVAIADKQTAVYPSTSPGGWHLIGRCPVPMFNRENKPNMPVAVGDTVRFSPVSRQEYLQLGGSLA